MREMCGSLPQDCNHGFTVAVLYFKPYIYVKGRVAANSIFKDKPTRGFYDGVYMD
jgi:hypothetical protein